MNQFYYLEVDPIPSNDAYSTHAWVVKGRARHIRFLQDYHRQWKEAVMTLLEWHDVDRGKPPFEIYSLHIYLYWDLDDFYFLDGEYQPRDLSGHCKLLEDALAKYFDIDDRYNIDLKMFKRPASYSSILVVVSGEFDIGLHDPSEVLQSYRFLSDSGKLQETIS